MQTDTTTTTKKTTTPCPKCASALQDFSVNFSYKVLMCENVKCPYPFDQPTANSFLVKDNSIPKIDKKNKGKHVRSSDCVPSTAPENPITDAPIQNNTTMINSDKEIALPETVATTSNYSLQDIEHLLQNEDMATTTTTTTSEFDTSSIQDLEQFFSSDSVSPEGSENGQPEQSCVTTPIDDQSGLFNGLDQILGDNWNKECDPFSTELDSLLGL
ncbi:hypothetical protein BDA99DRAFT_566199 [Phascolomyces articulosus]|uniref:Uncharacterized protein n=1 Tax=Phascolomyces articulosus TaxID=60185 RepID=A0AAD5JLM4_9FUNG|nr:hypothetical protein BDA99DRAFT_566199 [Phascolomyces articulosus]